MLPTEYAGTWPELAWRPSLRADVLLGERYIRQVGSRREHVSQSGRLVRLTPAVEPPTMRAMKPSVGKASIPKYKLSGLEPGDVLLSTSLHWLSSAIKVGTRSPFSHAAIYWGRMSFLEAVGHGVCNFNVLASAVSDKRSVRVLRLSSRFAADIRTRAAEAASSYIGREYWVEGAIKSPFGLKSDQSLGRVFCSHLVTQSFADAGVELCPGRRPEFVTPGDLAKSDLLEDVTDDVLYEASELELRGVVRIIDGDDPDTPQTAFHDAIKRVLIDVRAAFSDAGLQPPPTLAHAFALVIVLPDASKAARLDQKIATILDAAGYQHFSKTILFPEKDGSASAWNEDLLSAIPLPNLEATIATHRAMLNHWVSRNAERRRGIEMGREQYGYPLPFKTLEIQSQHEEVHCAAMERNIMMLSRELEKMQRIWQSRTLRTGRDETIS
jgi:uncharacterized protein YycO